MNTFPWCEPMIQMMDPVSNRHYRLGLTVLLTISSVGGDGMEIEKTGVVVHDHCTLGHSSGQNGWSSTEFQDLTTRISIKYYCNVQLYNYGASNTSSGNQKDTIKTTATKAGSNLLIVCWVFTKCFSFQLATKFHDKRSEFVYITNSTCGIKQ